MSLPKTLMDSLKEVVIEIKLDVLKRQKLLLSEYMEELNKENYDYTKLDNLQVRMDNNTEMLVMIGFTDELNKCETSEQFEEVMNKMKLNSLSSQIDSIAKNIMLSLIDELDEEGDE